MTYVSVLLICMLNNCQFMQSTVQFKSAKECEQATEVQKTRILKMAPNKVTQIEATCIAIKQEQWI